MLCYVKYIHKSSQRDPWIGQIHRFRPTSALPEFLLLAKTDVYNSTGKKKGTG